MSALSKHRFWTSLHTVFAAPEVDRLLLVDRDTDGVATPLCGTWRLLSVILVVSLLGRGGVCSSQ
jgi:hypothetical protein